MGALVQGKTLERSKTKTRRKHFHACVCALMVMAVLVFLAEGFALAASADGTKKKATAPAPVTKTMKKKSPVKAPTTKTKAKKLNIKKKTMAPGPSKTIMKKLPGQGSETIKKFGTMRGTLHFQPRVTIISFHKKPRPGMMMATGPSGDSGASAGPQSTEIILGESITLSWTIKTTEMDDLTLTFNGSFVSPGTMSTSGDDTIYRGERTVSPETTTTYTLRATGRTEGGGSQIAIKTFTVEVAAPSFNISTPSINQDNLTVSVAVRNNGDADFGPGPITVEYEVNAFARGASITPITGSFTTASMSIARGARADLGSFSLEDHRSRLMVFDDCRITLTVSGGADGPRTSETFTHDWEVQTFEIDNGFMSLLSMMSSYDIRLNNYGGGVHPHVADDCHISVNLMGTESTQTFNLGVYVAEVLVAIPPSPIPILQEIALYVNSITASERGPADLLSIRDGKLAIHLEFPNTGSREIKLGFHNWGRHDEFRDDPVADVELDAFTVDVLLTPVLSSGAITYGAVEVEADGVNATLIGALDDMLNDSSLVQNFLNDTLRDTIVSYLSSVLDNSSMRTSFEDGIESGLHAAGLGITRILSVSGSGDTITVEYM
jgi:hypothetical protein